MERSTPFDAGPFDEVKPMKYLCLVYHDQAKLDALAEGEFKALVAASLAYKDDLERSGRGLGAEGLEPVESATTIRLRGGKLGVVDGPFAETKEQLGGFYLIEARDLNEAIQLAAKMPPLQLGCIEIRPVRDLRAV